MQTWDYMNLRDIRREVRKGNIESKVPFTIIAKDGQKFVTNLSEILSMLHAYDIAKIDVSDVTDDQLRELPQGFFNTVLLEYHKYEEDELTIMYADFKANPREWMRNRSISEIPLKILDRVVFGRD